MKKLLSLLLVLTMVFAFMAMSGTAFAADDTLTVYAWDANFNIPALKAAEAAYQKVNPNFKLEIATQSGSSDVEQAMTLAGSSGDLSSLPDIVLFQDHFIQSYVADYPDCWVDLQLADIDWSDFGAEKLSYSTIDGVHYGVPVDNGTAIFAYRTDVLEEAGYTIDDVTGISWDEWLEIAKEVKEKTGFALLSMDHSGDDLPYMMMQAEGLSQWRSGKPNLVGNEAFERIIEVIVQGAKDGTILLANSWSEYCDQTIVGNQTAGVMNGNWIIPTIEQVAEARTAMRPTAAPPCTSPATARMLTWLATSSPTPSAAARAPWRPMTTPCVTAASSPAASAPASPKFIRKALTTSAARQSTATSSTWALSFPLLSRTITTTPPVPTSAMPSPTSSTAAIWRASFRTLRTRSSSRWADPASDARFIEQKNGVAPSRSWRGNLPLKGGFLWRKDAELSAGPFCLRPRP